MICCILLYFRCFRMRWLFGCFCGLFIMVVFILCIVMYIVRILLFLCVFVYILGTYSDILFCCTIVVCLVYFRILCIHCIVVFAFGVQMYLLFLLLFCFIHGHFNFYMLLYHLNCGIICQCWKVFISFRKLTLSLKNVLYL